MKKKYFFFYFISVFTIAVCGVLSGFAQDETVNISGDSRKSLSITIYNNKVGLVKEARGVKLPKGVYQVYFSDVASKIIATSVHINPLTALDSFRLLEQNYEYDLINHQKLMDKYVGKDVKLIFKSESTGAEEDRTAVLISNNESPVFKIGDEIHLGFPGRVILPKIPDNLLAKPTLVWLIDNNYEDFQDIEVSYLTDGISWECDYVLSLSKDDKTADLTGWVTIDNQSGTAYKDASLKLVAGDVKRVQPAADFSRQAYAMETAMPAPKGQFKEEGFFEYHLYTLQRKSTIKQNQIKQITLFEGKNVPVTKKFMVYGNTYLFSSQYENQAQDNPVEAVLEFYNSEKNNLGMPIPKGLIRVYKNDNDGMLQFAGENTINHTPKDEKIKLNIGNAFDIKAERKQTDYKKLRNDLIATQWEIAINNHKDEAIEVTVEESFPGDWKITDSSHKYEKITSSAVNFKVPVKANSKSTLKYSLETKF